MASTGRTTNAFGGAWTQLKLRLIGEYLQRFNTVLKNQPFERWYVDAFAGSGFSRPPGEEGELLRGSPLIALACNPPFHRLLFIEQKTANARELERVIASAPNPERARVINADANSELLTFCRGMKQGQRAVVFLDPFAMSVAWTTVTALAATRKCDVWFLFPVGAVNRLLTRTGKRDPSWDASLNEILGCTDWREEFYRLEGPDLLGDQVIRKMVSCEDIAEFYRRRLNDLFPGGAAPAYRMLKNSKESPLFALMFAIGNPAASAKGAAFRIANHILQKL